jgi:tight adherence protein C
MPLILAGLAGLSAVLFVLGAFRSNRGSAAARRRIAQLADAETLDERNKSFAARAVLPLFSRVATIAVKALPGNLVGATATKLETAGMRISVHRFMLWWIGIAAIGPTLLGLVLITQDAGMNPKLLLAFGAWIAMGLLAPWVYVSGRSRERLAVIDRSLPDVVDLIVTNIESGLALQAAMLSVASRFPGPIADEFSKVIRDTSMGRPREEAIEAMAERVGSKDMQLFSRAIMQAERTGIPVGKVLRSQAGEIRRRRRQRAREKAGKMPVKMTILTVAFMFPTLFMLLLGPVVMNMMRSMRA